MEIKVYPATSSIIITNDDKHIFLNMTYLTSKFVHLTLMKSDFKITPKVFKLIKRVLRDYGIMVYTYTHKSKLKMKEIYK